MARTPLGERVARTAIVTPRIRAVDRTVIEDNTAVIFVGEESIADCPQPIHLVERENRQRDLRPTAQRGCCDALCQTPIALHALVGVVIDKGPNLVFVDLTRFAVWLRARDRKSTHLNSSHYCASRMPSSA